MVGTACIAHASLEYTCVVRMATRPSLREQIISFVYFQNRILETHFRNDRFVPFFSGPFIEVPGVGG